MKKLTILMFLTVFALKTVAQTKQVALVSLQADRLIEADAMFGGIDTEVLRHFKDISNDPKFNLKPILEQFHDDFFTKYVPQMPVKFLDESEVITNTGYKNYVQNLVKKSETGQKLLSLVNKLDEHNYLTYPGYQALIPTDESPGLLDKLVTNAVNQPNNNPKVIDVFDGKVDGLMYIDIAFALSTKSSVIGFATSGLVGEGHMVAYINIGLYNKQGKKVFLMSEKAYSDQKFDNVAGFALKVKADDILPMCQNATNNLFKTLENKIPKMTKKIDSKL